MSFMDALLSAALHASLDPLADAGFGEALDLRRQPEPGRLRESMALD